MKFRFSNRIGTLVVALSIAQSGLSLGGQSIAKETPVLVEALAKQLVQKKTVKVAAVDFTDLQGRPNELGRFLADQVSVELVMADGITVIDRANLNAIMAEHKLTAEGLVNPENAKKLGQFAGVEAVLVGSLTPMDGAVQLTVRAISTDSSALVAAGRMMLVLTDDVRRMLGLSVSAGSRASMGALTAAPAGAATTAPVAAPVSVGPVVAAVKDVVYATVGGQPQIRVTVEFENRNLNASIAIAANSAVANADRNYGGRSEAPTLNNSYGGLTDSGGMRWFVPVGSLRGLSSVYCFETVGTGHKDIPPKLITQNAPANIVGYIRSATRYDGSGLQDVTQRYWSGDFSVIEPGGKLEVTATFLPVPPPETSSNRSGSLFAPRRDSGAPSLPAGPPASFDLSLELVLGTVKESERPERASDLSLRNLSINRIVVPR